MIRKVTDVNHLDSISLTKRSKLKILSSKSFLDSTGSERKYE